MSLFSSPTKAGQSDVGTEIATLKNEIKWIIGVGTAIIGLAAYLYVHEIPDKITAASSAVSDKLPENFKERFAKLEASAENIQKRYGGITPSSLLNLVPAMGEKPTSVVLVANLQRADHVIQSAYDLDLPGDPMGLSRVSTRLQNVKDEYADTPSAAAAVMSTEAHLASYALFSRGAYDTSLSLFSPPRTETNGINIPALSDLEKTHGIGVVANFTFECTRPTAGAIVGDPPQAASNVIVFQVRVKGCQQRQLAYFSWIRDEFDHATVMYDGGPLTLVQTTFNDCTFQFGNNLNSKRALAIIQAAKGNPVNIYFP
jgi:hypothetical protein